MSAFGINDTSIETMCSGKYFDRTLFIYSRVFHNQFCNIVVDQSNR
jgi:hypothetical protein